MDGADTSSPGLAFPKSRMDRSLPEVGMSGTGGILFWPEILGDEEALPVLDCLRSCCIIEATFFVGRVPLIATSLKESVEETEAVAVLTSETCLVVVGSGAGGGARLVSVLDLGAALETLRTLFDGEGGSEPDSWKRVCEVLPLLVALKAGCAGGERKEEIGGSTRLAMDGDALARLGICDGPRGEAKGPVP